MSKRKWEKGRAYCSLAAFVTHFEEGRGVFFNHKYVSTNWIQNWSLHTITWGIRAKIIFEAIPLREP